MPPPPEMILRNRFGIGDNYGRLEILFSPIKAVFPTRELTREDVEAVWNGINYNSFMFWGDPDNPSNGINWGKILFFFSHTPRGQALVAGVLTYWGLPDWFDTLGDARGFGPGPALPNYRATLFLMAFGVNVILLTSNDFDPMLQPEITTHDIPKENLEELRKVAKGYADYFVQSDESDEDEEDDEEDDE